MEVCITCGMPLDKSENIGGKVEKGSVCIHCVTDDGEVRPCEEIFEGGVEFFMQMMPDKEKSFAERLVRKNMNRLPYWQNNKGDCLDGEEATDEEFAELMSKF